MSCRAVASPSNSSQTVSAAHPGFVGVDGVVVFVDVPAGRGQIVPCAVVGEERGNHRVVGESVRHDLAGRGDDVVGRAAQIVERFDRRHETGVEEQVVEPHAGAVDRGGEFRKYPCSAPRSWPNQRVSAAPGIFRHRSSVRRALLRSHDELSIDAGNHPFAWEARWSPKRSAGAAAMSPRMRSMTAGSVVRPGSGV